MESRKRRPSASLVIAFVALAVAIGGTAVAASKIGPKQLKANAVTSAKIKNGAVKSPDIGDGTVASIDLAPGAVGTGNIADGSITGAKVASETLSDKNISDYELIGNSPVRVVATEAATEAAARTAAPENVLFTKGQLTIYAKCFRDTTGAGTVFGEIYARTSADGALLEGDDDLPGQPGATLLNTNTLETDRQLDTQSVNAANQASYDEAEEALTSADLATDLHLVTHIGVKQGALPAGDGAF